MRSHLSYVALALLSACVLLAGCGADLSTAAPNGQVQIIESSEIATGAWTIIGDSSGPGTYGVVPISGLIGALNATGTSVQAAFTIGSSDPSNPSQSAPCLNIASSFANDTLTASGTASNGVLTLDSDFAANHLHLVAQLSTDRKSIVSGSYTVTGACATTASYLEGNWNAPLTGIYKGQLNSLSGSNPQVTATFTQANYYVGPGGYIPFTGTMQFTTPTCTTTVELNGAYILGYLNFIDGYTSTTTYVGGNPIDNFYFLADENPDSTIISDANWGYPNSSCGAENGDTSNPGQLVRQ